jgi:hypothetical protein
MATKSVTTLLEDIRFMSEDRYETVQAVRALVKKLVKPLSEEVKYGGILFSSGAQFGGVFAYKEHVSVEFSNGAAIEDTLGHLEGSGKLRRHVKLVSLADLKAKQLAQYISLASKAANR